MLAPTRLFPSAVSSHLDKEQNDFVPEVGLQLNCHSKLHQDEVCTRHKLIKGALDEHVQHTHHAVHVVV